MKQRARIYYTESQKALMWERWRAGDNLHQIANLFDRHHTSVQGILVLRGDKDKIGIGQSEVTLLKGLAEAPGHKLDHWRLLELLKLEPDDKGKSVLEIRISRLKKKMAEAGAPEPAIKSLWKEGYQLCTPVSLGA
jgi:DNA-binding response OmpR family regulator